MLENSPSPLVWSASGPVSAVGVLPECSFQANSSSPWLLVYWQRLGASKSHFRRSMMSSTPKIKSSISDETMVGEERTLLYSFFDVCLGGVHVVTLAYIHVCMYFTSIHQSFQHLHTLFSKYIKIMGLQGCTQNCKVLKL